MRNLIESDIQHVNKPLARREIDVPSFRLVFRDEESLKTLSPEAAKLLLAATALLAGLLPAATPAIHLFPKFLLNHSPPERTLPTSPVANQAPGQQCTAAIRNEK